MNSFIALGQGGFNDGDATSTTASSEKSTSSKAKDAKDEPNTVSLKVGDSMKRRRITVSLEPETEK